MHKFSWKNLHFKTCFFNEEHFPFHDDFFNTRIPLKTLTESSSLPFSLPTVSNSHIGETTLPDNNNLGDKQEPSNPTESFVINLSRDQAANDSTRSNPISKNNSSSISLISKNNSPNNIPIPDLTETVARDHQDLVEQNTNINTHWTKSKVGIHKLNKPYVGFVETITDEKEPENVTEELTRPQ